MRNVYVIKIQTLLIRYYDKKIQKCQEKANFLRQKQYENFAKRLAKLGVIDKDDPKITKKMF